MNISPDRKSLLTKRLNTPSLVRYMRTSRWDLRCPEREAQLHTCSRMAVGNGWAGQCKLALTLSTAAGPGQGVERSCRLPLPRDGGGSDEGIFDQAGGRPGRPPRFPG